MISRDTYIELTKFAIVGGICFGLDLAIYYGLTELLSTPTFVAKSIGVISATFLNYYLNKTWTWGQSNRDLKRFSKYMFLYAISGLLNVISNELFLKVLPNYFLELRITNNQHQYLANFLTLKIDKFLAVIFATLIGMMVNFFGQKVWIFNERNTVEETV